MKYLSVVAIAALLGLLAAVSAQAQFPNTYKAVNSFSYNPNVGTVDPATGTTPGTVNVTVAFSGSTTGSQQMNNSGIRHTPHAYVGLNNHVQSAVGPATPPANNMAWSQTFSFDLFADGCDWALLNAGACVLETKPQIQCPIYGMISIPWQDIQFEVAITYSYISSIIDSNGMHPEAPYCNPASMPPDFPGPDQALPGTPSGQVVNVVFMDRQYAWGTSPTGLPWEPVFNYGLGYYVKNTFYPPACTNWDKNFRNLVPLPPLDPQP